MTWGCGENMPVRSGPLPGKKSCSYNAPVRTVMTNEMTILDIPPDPGPKWERCRQE